MAAGKASDNIRAKHSPSRKGRWVVGNDHRGNVAIAGHIAGKKTAAAAKPQEGKIPGVIALTQQNLPGDIGHIVAGNGQNTLSGLIGA